ncbi:adenine nucleotide alpha hydrolases-like protein [Rhizodiscina lignyota]|uniref:FAD synthase n=1 Tax=Rhizodiscina lignyota TaxID=1504668 RepID=A0A9P4IKM5_9PEZI|nr:adenine nucleotide alpha hydrolases-like protein [Rhizodiscina lignyota]
MTATERTPGDANGISTHRHDILKSASSADAPLIPEAPVDLETLCGRVHDRVAQFLEEDVQDEVLKRVQEQTRIAIRVIEEALDRYSLSQLSLSYNGGKDCLVLLVLYLSALYSHHLRSSASESSSSEVNSSSCSESSLHFYPIQSVYIKSAHAFPEVEAFVSLSESLYSLSLSRYTAPMKAAFASYLADRPTVKAIFVGTRRTDPHGSALTHFDQTDHGWPTFMRVHPVIDWHYVDIWTFIRYLNIPYCKLYDLGYTSLGGTKDTMPNPALRLPGCTPIDPQFKPAYELVEDTEERLGRERVPASGFQTPVKDLKSP